MSRLGADVAELEAIAAELQGYARRIDAARAGIEHELARTAWTGPDADGFRRRWRTIAVRDLDGFRSELTSSAAELRRQATQQRVASADSLGAASGLVAGGFASALMGGALGVGAVGARAGRAAGALAGSGLTAGAVGTVGGVVGAMYGVPGGALVAGAVVASRSNLDAKTAVGGTKAAVGALLTVAGEIPSAAKATAGRLGIYGKILTGGTAAIEGYFGQYERDLDRHDLSDQERVARASNAAQAEATVTLGMSVGGAVIGGVVFGALGSVVPGAGTAAGAAFGKVVGGYLGGKAADPLIGSSFGRTAIDGWVELNTAARGVVADAATSAAEAGREVAGVVGGAAADAVDTVSGWANDASDAVNEWSSDAVDRVGGAVDRVKGWF